MKLARESWWLGLICTADMLLTAWLLARGQAQEANPIMRYYVDTVSYTHLTLPTNREV